MLLAEIEDWGVVELEGPPKVSVHDTVCISLVVEDELVEVELLDD